ncbi:GDSL-type esterase/lipase family protein [Novosphingobium sp. Fuku2-ISO-50]|uniref:GDSL-type esterase/lipase family protein n=1 Tax=Novosphingobium sp. Fuku2-ISO-50 TaxID=1739114 RepID=UPI00076C6EA6|nr:GDSL-type esterase/lipase family protein [Novosphingobium sp. Fuku2-ISO-50]KUR74163.1 GDSL family lipase [Novosphingobium sp. Fuku2-ISO-50]
MRFPVSCIAVLALAGCGPAPGAQGNDAPDPALIAPTDMAPMHAAVPAGAPVILAFGDSLYAGYRLDPNDSYPVQLEAALNAAGVPARVINGAVSGDTTAAALQRLAFTLDNQPKKPALVMVGLGGNDMLRGLPPAQTRANMEAIVTGIEARHIPVLLTGMLAGHNLGPDYAQAFNPIWPQLARGHHTALVPFFLQPVIGNNALLLDDHIHPNREGVAAIVKATEPAVAAALKR